MSPTPAERRLLQHCRPWPRARRQNYKALPRPALVRPPGPPPPHRQHPPWAWPLSATWPTSWPNTCPRRPEKVKEAYRFSDEMHLGQMRRSGEPYISHPIAVAEICADWKLDAQAIMAALLHDVMEDQDVKKEELIERFGAPVAHLVDGLSKLERSNSRARSKRRRKTSARCCWPWPPTCA